jgi:nucleotide-binding universal stress UspA family protein
METIVCPTDFSKCADNALHYAHELSQLLHARLILFHSIFNLDALPALLPYGAIGEVAYVPPTKDPAFEKEQWEKLDKIKEKFKKQHPESRIQYESRIRYGLVKESLRGLVKDEHANLVVMGTEGADGFDEVLFSSYTAEALSTVDCPMLIVPHHVKYKPVQRIVFATDLEGEPHVAISLVLKLAATYDAEILFLHILPKDDKQAREGVQAEMNQLYKALPYDKVSFFAIPSADIEAGISHFVHKQKADLLVMGRHSRSFWQRLYQKDHAREMTYHAKLPLLVLPYKH